MSWNDERVEQLRKLWSEGLSASQIAAELGGVTRNAVIGKVHRLQLSGRVKAAAPAAQRNRKTVAAARPVVRPAARTIVTQRGNLAVVQTIEVEEPVVYRAAEEVVVPISRRISIMDLREGTCRWPMGDPLNADFVFCGGDCEVGKPYCSAHSQVAYQPSLERRRVRI